MDTVADKLWVATCIDNIVCPSPSDDPDGSDDDVGVYEETADYDDIFIADYV